MFSGLCLTEFLTRPQNMRSKFKASGQSATQPPQLNSLEWNIDEENEVSCRHLISVVYASLGELPAFLFGWMEILVNITAVSACR